AKKNKGYLMSIAHTANVNLLDILSISPVKEDMQNIVKTTFTQDNPYTGLKDAPINSFYSIYIPLLFFCKVIPPQFNENKMYFNAEGSVTIAEVLDSINSIFNEYNSNKKRKLSLDGVSVETDFFNEGYNLVLSSYSNPMYNLYSRFEMLRPITRVELAYIIVCCMSVYKKLYGSLVGTDYLLGNSFDWLNADELKSNYVDGFNYDLEIEEHLSIDLKDYKGNRLLTDYIDAMRKDVEKIPLPLYMSLLELGERDLFYFNDSKLEPLSEVTRGELCYTLIKLCNSIVENGVEV
ncbi:MAG: hypothetical protein IJZ36_02150, partial [Bacilli bacterium]|nr:hypothetical protein [Bacilli bacterium]